MGFTGARLNECDKREAGAYTAVLDPYASLSEGNRETDR